MRLSQIERFELRPNERIQLILGTNGSGKSSLMSEINPLPPTTSDFTKDGSKTIKILHRGHRYETVSVFEPSARHSFVKDGVELNEGGTASAQRELARQEFNYTPDIRNLLTGKERFTRMSPNRRKEWFTQLSDVSYDYALAVFNRVKKRARDLAGALDTNKRRLVTETAKLISQAEEEQLRAEVKLLESQLAILQQIRMPQKDDPESLGHDIRRHLSQLEELSRQFLNKTKLLEDSRAWSGLDEIDGVIDACRQELSALEALISEDSKVHQDLERQIHILSQTGEEGLDDLRKRYKALAEERVVVLGKQQLALHTLDPRAATQALHAIKDDLVILLTEIPANTDRRFNQQAIKENEDLIVRTKDQLLRLDTLSRNLIAKRDAMEAHRHDGETKCPKCMHSWVHGWDPVKHASLSEEVVNVSLEIERIQGMLEEIELRQSEFNEYRRLYGDWVRTTKACSILNPFWDYVADQQLIIDAPKRILTLLGSLEFDLELQLKDQELEKQQGELNKLIAQKEELGTANLSTLNVRLTEIVGRVESRSREVGQLRGKIQTLQTQKTQLTQLLELAERVKQQEQSVKDKTDYLLEQLQVSFVLKSISRLQGQLAVKVESLAAIELQAGIVKDLESSIAKLEVEEQAAKALVKALSPQEGLIAEGLLGFIRLFTGQMNALIKKIWTYPLFIHPCGTATETGAELDYKFPLMVQSKDNIVADVSDGSTGQCEGVDLAFKVVAMRYLGLAEAPLFLDEFGAALDKEHRFAAMNVIKSLLDTQSFSQLFIVSHYEESYGAFTNAELCVLCSNNIVIPSEFKYNQHVTIE